MYGVCVASPETKTTACPLGVGLAESEDEPFPHPVITNAARPQMVAAINAFFARVFFGRIVFRRVVTGEG